MDIGAVDLNFKIDGIDYKKGINYFDIEAYPFKIYGLIKENGIFCRIPKAVAEAVSDGVSELYSHTSGGRVRFAVNSRKIIIKALMHNVGRMPHFALSGSAGFDMYIKKDGKNIYYKTFMPPFDITDGYESEINFDTDEKREITINFPLYSGVKKLYIGLCENSELSPAEDYKTEKPVVFYGSSITQGGCASRPGNSYEAIVSRELDCNYINLGFSGSAKAEKAMADYIKNISMSAFVYDYDYNAPDAEYLKKTHKRMFDIIRKTNPDLPILMLSMPKSHLTKEDLKRLEIIKETYEDARNNGDKNVYFISGEDLISKEFSETWSVDDCHPNDSGFVSMAQAITEMFQKNILE